MLKDSEFKFRRPPGKSVPLTGFILHSRMSRRLLKLMIYALMDSGQDISDKDVLLFSIYSPEHKYFEKDLITIRATATKRYREELLFPFDQRQLQQQPAAGR